MNEADPLTDWLAKVTGIIVLVTGVVMLVHLLL